MTVESPTTTGLSLSALPPHNPTPALVCEQEGSKYQMILHLPTI